RGPEIEVDRLGLGSGHEAIPYVGKIKAGYRVPAFAGLTGAPRRSRKGATAEPCSSRAPLSRQERGSGSFRCRTLCDLSQSIRRFASLPRLRTICPRSRLNPGPFVPAARRRREALPANLPAAETSSQR